MITPTNDQETWKHTEYKNNNSNLLCIYIEYDVKIVVLLRPIIKMGRQKSQVAQAWSGYWRAYSGWVPQHSVPQIHLRLAVEQQARRRGHTSTKVQRATEYPPIFCTNNGQANPLQANASEKNPKE